MVAPEYRPLIEAFRAAVDGEHRFGLRADARPELDARWERVIELLTELCQTTADER